VSARRSGTTLRTEVRLARPGTSLTIGHVLPADREVRSVRLDGAPVEWRVARTARGRELVADTVGGTHVLVIRLA
jgi:hypothetical protein